MPLEETVRKLIAYEAQAGKDPRDAADEIIADGAFEASVVQLALERYLERAKSVRVLRDPPILVANHPNPWYTGPDLERDLYWPPLRSHLLDEKGWAETVVDSVDESTSKILSYLDPPHSGEEFSARGLVLGHVQSGKTANYTALMAKAADRGYRLLVVLSGLHNGLRHQTQLRLSAELVGTGPRDDWFQATSEDHDFEAPDQNASTLFSKQDLRLLAVVKKNGTRLKHLRDWIASVSARTRANCPALIIDDEADQASINTAKSGADPTAINRHIREILDLLPRSAYVGYTATPFANVLIDPTAEGDLYPERFIVDLPKPAGHYGPEVIFGRPGVEDDPGDLGSDGFDMVREVPETDLPQVQPGSPADRDTFQPHVTPALRRAFEYFLMATAARHHRGQRGEHSTMLVHTTVHPVVHEKMRSRLLAERDKLAREIAAESSQTLSRLEAVWADEIRRVPAAEFNNSPVSFRDVRGHLEEVIAHCSVKTDNSASEDRLSYEEDGQIVVAVGGNTLSRGLTLEGLVSSYFVRSATAYDTLLQMGRWFGYRPGYADLPRVWMTTELEGWFRDMARVEHEIRLDISRYEAEHVSPRELAVRIRCHPMLAVTAASKMRGAVRAYAAYGGRKLQTIRFNHRDRDWLEGNHQAARHLITSARQRGCMAQDLPTGPSIVRGVPAADILEFLGSYRFDDSSYELRTDLLTRYIRKQGDLDPPRLQTWNVAVMSTASSARGTIDLGLDEESGLIQRARLKGTGNADIKALMSKVDRVVDVPDLDPAEVRATAESRLTAIRDKALGDPPAGLLLLYPIDKDSEPRDLRRDIRRPLGAVHHVIGVGLVFPGTSRETEVDYLSADLSSLRGDEMTEAEVEMETRDELATTDA